MSTPWAGGGDGSRRSCSAEVGGPRIAAATGLVPGKRKPYAAAGTVCESCKIARARCDGNLPCARCFRLNKTCRPLLTQPKKRGRKPRHAHPEPGAGGLGAAAAHDDDDTASYATATDSRPGSTLTVAGSPLPWDGSSPLLDLVIDRADPGIFAELYLQAFSQLFNANAFSRPRVLSLVRAWRGFAHAVGEDPTHGLLGHMRRAFSFTELELEGVEGLMQDAPAAVRRVRFEMDLFKMAAASQELKHTDVFRIADDGKRGVALFVYAHDRFIMASNDAYDRLWRSSAELFEDACRRKTIPHLLLASVVDPADRFNFYRGMLTLQYGINPGQKVCNFIKMVDRSGDIRLYLMDARHVSVNGLDGILAVTESAPSSKHVTARADLMVPLARSNSTGAASYPGGRAGNDASSVAFAPASVSPLPPGGGGGGGGGSSSPDSGARRRQQRGMRRHGSSSSSSSALSPVPLPVMGGALPSDPQSHMTSWFAQVKAQPPGREAPTQQQQQQQDGGFVGLLNGLFGRTRMGSGGVGGRGEGPAAAAAAASSGLAGVLAAVAGSGFGGLGGVMAALRGVKELVGEEEGGSGEEEDSEEEEEDGDRDLSPAALACLEYWRQEEESAVDASSSSSRGSGRSGDDAGTDDTSAEAPSSPGGGHPSSPAAPPLPPPPPPPVPVLLGGFAGLPGVGALGADARAGIMASIAHRAARLKPPLRERVLLVLVSRAAAALPPAPRTRVLEAVAEAAASLLPPACHHVYAAVATRGGLSLPPPPPVPLPPSPPSSPALGAGGEGEGWAVQFSPQKQAQEQGQGQGMGYNYSHGQQQQQPDAYGGCWENVKVPAPAPVTVAEAMMPSSGSPGRARRGRGGQQEEQEEEEQQQYQQQRRQWQLEQQRQWQQQQQQQQQQQGGGQAQEAFAYQYQQQPAQPLAPPSQQEEEDDDGAAHAGALAAAPGGPGVRGGGCWVKIVAEGDGEWGGWQTTEQTEPEAYAPAVATYQHHHQHQQQHQQQQQQHLSYTAVTPMPAMAQGSGQGYGGLVEGEHHPHHHHHHASTVAVASAAETGGAPPPPMPPFFSLSATPSFASCGSGHSLPPAASSGSADAAADGGRGGAASSSGGHHHHPPPLRAVPIVTVMGPALPPPVPPGHFAAHAAHSAVHCTTSPVPYMDEATMRQVFADDGDGLPSPFPPSRP